MTHLKITDEIVEDIALMLFFGARDPNAAYHIVFDRLGLPPLDRASIDAMDLTARLYRKIEELKAAHE